MAQGHTTGGDFIRPRKMKRAPQRAATDGPAPHVEAPLVEHTIHEDGTYSNDVQTGKVDIKNLKRDDTLIFGRTFPASFGVVHKIVDKGIYCRPKKDELPDMRDCIFYNWEEIKDLCTEVV